MATIQAPNEHYDGTGPGGANFYNGRATIADTETAALDWYRERGYTVDGLRTTEPDIKPPASESVADHQDRRAQLYPETGGWRNPVGSFRVGDQTAKLPTA